MSTLTSDLIAEIASADELTRVLSWLDDLALVADARPQAPMVALLAARRCCSVRTIYNKLSALQTHGPLALRDKRSARLLAKAPAGHRSPTFVQFVHQLYYQVARNNATPSVQQLLLQRLRAWRQDPANPDLRIPGYDRPPVDSAESRYRHPKGWSLRNLNEIKPDKYQRAEGGIGRQHGDAHLPPVLTTRVGLRPGEAYLFDDQYCDLLVHYGAEVVRPVGLNVLDLASGCDIVRGIRPELRDNPDGEKTLVREDTLWLVVHILTVEGYNPDRCRLILESGTSTIGEDFQRHIALVTDRRVTVDIGAVSKDIVRGVLLPSKGNPRFKAARESWFNLLRNRMGHLPLALGMDRDHKPEDTDRLSAEDKNLLALVPHLPPTVARDLAFEGLPWSRFLPLYNAVCEALNQRTDHNLEGWASEGRERILYRLDQQWIDESEYLQLPPDTRGLIIRRMHAGEIVSRVERLSPRHVFESGRDRLARISPFRWHLLIPHKYALARRVPDNRMLVVKARRYGPEPIHFQPYLIDERGEQRPMPAGADILLFLSPISPTFALVTRPDGTVLGLVHPVAACTRFDDEGLIEQYAQRHQLRAEIGGTAKLHNEQLAARREARRESNAHLAEQAGLDQKAVAKILKPAAPRAASKKAPKPQRPAALVPALAEPHDEGLGVL